MSSNSVVFNNGQQMQIQTNLAKLFPFEKELRSYVRTNSEYTDEELAAGTVLVVNKSTGEVEPFDSDIHTADQYYFCVLASDYTVEASDEANVSVGVTGTRVRENMLVFINEADDLETVVGDMRVFEHLLSCGIIPIGSTNATRFDNTL
jgi:hypothetical protein